MSAHSILLDAIRQYDFFRAERTENVSDTKIIVGHAPIGTENNEAKWLIVQLELVEGVLEKRWANGNSESDKIWNSRGSYTYK